ncbi:MAG: hypothetical protein IBX64_06290 [Actinobacteria bacterium]|nr:hypothetical protein [Actinomycetota bacterium]
MRTIQTARKMTTVRQLQRKEQLKTKKKLRVVKEKNRHTLSIPEIPFPIFILSVTVLTVGLIVNVAQQALVSQLSYETESVKREIQLAQQVQEKLLAQKVKLESPQRIESIAIKKLSMVKAPKISYIRVELDTPRVAANKYSIANPVDSVADVPGRNTTARNTKLD